MHLDEAACTQSHVAWPFLRNDEAWVNKEVQPSSAPQMSAQELQGAPTSFMFYEQFTQKIAPSAGSATPKGDNHHTEDLLIL